MSHSRALRAAARTGLALATVALAAGCSLLFPFEGSARPGQDAATAPQPDASVDAEPSSPCPDRPLDDRGHDDCLGCGDPCGPHRPFCCAGSCCSDECGSPGNECSREPEPIPVLDAGPPLDAGHPEWPDGGCDPWAPESCLGCGLPCSPHRPFCCGAICCAEECGTLAGGCSTDP